MKNWFIIQSHSSFENKVAQIIKEEAEKAKITEKIDEGVRIIAGHREDTAEIGRAHSKRTMPVG